MGKKILILSVLLTITMAACQSAAGSPTTPPSVESGVVGDTPSAVASPTADIAPTATREAQADQAEDSGATNCTVVSRQPTPGPTEQSLVPGVSEADWVIGPDSASVTFIEYGDFQ